MTESVGLESSSVLEPVVQGSFIDIEWVSNSTVSQNEASMLIPFTYTDVQMALEDLKEGKKPGLDFIPVECFAKLREYYQGSLLTCSMCVWLPVIFQCAGRLLRYVQS